MEKPPINPRRVKVRFTADQIAAAQLLAQAYNQHAIRRAIGQMKPEGNGFFAAFPDGEVGRFLSETVRKRTEANELGARWCVRVFCQPRDFLFTTATFEEAVAYATPFESLFPVRILQV